MKITKLNNCASLNIQQVVNIDGFATIYDFLVEFAEESSEKIAEPKYSSGMKRVRKDVARTAVQEQKKEENSDSINDEEKEAEISLVESDRNLRSIAKNEYKAFVW